MKLTIKTRGHYDFIDITERVKAALMDIVVKDGAAVIFVSGTTAALTIMEYEEGTVKDLKKVFEAWAPENADYEHHKKWGDHNGAAHVKSALVGTDLAVPIEEGKLTLGTWQSIVLIDFDEKPRTREVIIKVIWQK